MALDGGCCASSLKLDLDEREENELKRRNLNLDVKLSGFFFFGDEEIIECPSLARTLHIEIEMGQECCCHAYLMIGRVIVIRCHACLSQTSSNITEIVSM